MSEKLAKRGSKNSRRECLFELFAQFPTRFISAVEDFVSERDLFVVELGEKSDFVQHTYRRKKDEHYEWYTELRDQLTSQSTSSVRAAREAKDTDLVARTVVLHQKGVTTLDVRVEVPANNSC